MATHNLTYHYSTKLEAIAPCRAREHCPYEDDSDHNNVSEWINEFKKQAKDSSYTPPSFMDGSGQMKPIVLHENGDYTIGKRRYTKDGEKVLSPSSLRSRKSRAKKSGDS